MGTEVRRRMGTEDVERRRDEFQNWPFWDVPGPQNGRRRSEWPPAVVRDDAGALRIVPSEAQRCAAVGLPSELPSIGRSGRCGRPQNCPSGTSWTPSRLRLDPPRNSNRSPPPLGNNSSLDPPSSTLEFDCRFGPRGASSCLRLGPPRNSNRSAPPVKKHIGPRTSILDSRLFLPCW